MTGIPEKFYLKNSGGGTIATSVSDALFLSVHAAKERKIKELGITCIFTEPQFNPGLVNAITTNNKMTVGIIDPLGSHLSLGKNFYPDLLSSIAETIKDCRP